MVSALSQGAGHLWAGACHSGNLVQWEKVYDKYSQKQVKCIRSFLCARALLGLNTDDLI